MTDQTDILQDVADTILQDSERYTFTYEKHTWLTKLGIGKPHKVTLRVQDPTSGNMVRISRALLKVPTGAVKLSERETQKFIYELMHNHTHTVVYIVAVAMTNSREEPSTELLEQIRWNMPTSRLMEIADYLVSRMDIAGFLNSMALIRGNDILTPRASPMDQAEIIAPGASSEEPVNTGSGQKIS